MTKLRVRSWGVPTGSDDHHFVRYLSIEPRGTRDVDEAFDLRFEGSRNRRYRFCHLTLDLPSDDGPVMFGVAVPYVGALWVEVLPPRDWDWTGSRNPLRRLFAYDGERSCAACSGTGVVEHRTRTTLGFGAAICSACNGSGVRRGRLQGPLTDDPRRSGVVIDLDAMKLRVMLAACQHGATTDARLRFNESRRRRRRRLRPMGLRDKESVAVLRSGFEWAVPLDLAELVYGPMEAVESTRLGQQRSVAVLLPEGAYMAWVKMERLTFKRRRAKRPAGVELRTTIEPVTPIPVPGKAGTSGDDAIHRSTGAWSSPEEAAHALRRSVLERRRAVPGWEPRGGWPL